MAKRVVDVLVPVALDRAYSYRVPDALNLTPGDIVSVPLGAREATAVVWADNPKPDIRLDNRLKDVEEKLDVPPLRPELRSFVDWVANYTVATRGMVLRMCLRMGEHLGAERERVGVKRAGAAPQRMTTARARALELLADGLLRAKSDAAREAGVSAGVIDGLIDEGTLQTVVLPPEPVAARPDPDFTQSEFTADQRAAADALKSTVAKGGYSVTLLDGVTGSGKTEVYFEAVADTVRAGRQSLILMPEIALTAQFLDRFAARFGVRPAEWHSQLSPRKRARAWSAVAKGEVSVVVGARSALFLPYADLGLIVVDEEHDPAYKQEDGVHYHARDMAVVRGHIAKIPVVLASATPSLETEVNARRGRYARLHLPERFGGQSMPTVEAIDLRHERPPPGRFIAPTLAGAVKTAIERGEQALLFLNRRGYAPLTLCRACGFRLLLPELRRLAGRSPLPPAAGLPPLRLRHAASGQLPEMPGGRMLRVAVGPGVERLEEEGARSVSASARMLVLSSDLVASVERMREEFADIAAGKFDIVIGTQLVAKGHHFPKLNLVGVVDADLGLEQRRSARRRAHLPAPASGGRPRRPRAGVGHGYLQTHQPEHPVMRALIAQDREAFYSREIAQREAAHYPPFGRLASLVVSGDKNDAASMRGRSPAPHRRPIYSQGERARARPRRGAALVGARPPSLAFVAQGAARVRSVGLFARMACRRAEEARFDQARHRRRSAELFVDSSFRGRAKHGEGVFGAGMPSISLT